MSSAQGSAGPVACEHERIPPGDMGNERLRTAIARLCRQEYGDARILAGVARMRERSTAWRVLVPSARLELLDAAEAAGIWTPEDPLP